MLQTCACSCKGTSRWAAACSGCQRQTGKMSRGRVADLFRIPDVVGLDAADGGKGNRANTADADGGKGPTFRGGQCKGYFIDQAGTQPCRTGLLCLRLGFMHTHCHVVCLTLGFMLWCCHFRASVCHHGAQSCTTQLTFHIRVLLFGDQFDAKFVASVQPCRTQLVLHIGIL